LPFQKPMKQVVTWTTLWNVGNLEGKRLAPG
jgi:hypothetical protein